MTHTDRRYAGQTGLPTSNEFRQERRALYWFATGSHWCWTNNRSYMHAHQRAAIFHLPL